MKKKLLKIWIIGSSIAVVTVMASAYNTQIWAPVQFVKQLFATPTWEVDATKATIQLDGRDWSIHAKSLWINGKQVIKWDKLVIGNIQVDSWNWWNGWWNIITQSDIPNCKSGFVLTKTSTWFKCIVGWWGGNLDKSFDILGFIFLQQVKDWVYKTVDGYYVVDSSKVLYWCNNRFVPDRSKCIVKIWNLYIAPDSTETTTNHIWAKNYCLNLPAWWRFNRRLPSRWELDIMYTKDPYIYWLDRTRYWSRDYAWSHYNRRNRRSTYYVKLMSYWSKSWWRQKQSKYRVRCVTTN